MGKVVAIGLALVVGIILLGWVLNVESLLRYRTFAPQWEAARREVFEETKSYNQGMIQELQNMQFEYAKASPEQQQALASIILRRTADYDLDRMPSDLRAFVQQLRRERMGR